MTKNKRNVRGSTRRQNLKERKISLDQKQKNPRLSYSGRCPIWLVMPSLLVRVSSRLSVHTAQLSVRPTSDKDSMDKAHRGTSPFPPSSTMSGNSPPGYYALFLKADEERKQAEERQRLAEERERQERERNWLTTFPEFVQYCHNLLWKSLRVQIPSRSTTGQIPYPTGKSCPMQLLPWTDCETR